MVKKVGAGAREEVRNLGVNMQILKYLLTSEGICEASSSMHEPGIQKRRLNLNTNLADTVLRVAMTFAL